MCYKVQPFYSTCCVPFALHWPHAGNPSNPQRQVVVLQKCRSQLLQVAKEEDEHSANSDQNSGQTLGQTLCSAFRARTRRWDVLRESTLLSRYTVSICKYERIPITPCMVKDRTQVADVTRTCYNSNVYEPSDVRCKHGYGAATHRNSQ